MVKLFLVVVESDNGKRIGLDEEDCGQVLGVLGEGEDAEAAVQTACTEHGIPAFDNSLDGYLGPSEL